VDSESYELVENVLVLCHVIPGFYILYCFAYYFNVYTHIYVYIHKSYWSWPNNVETHVSNLNNCEEIRPTGDG